MNKYLITMMVVVLSTAAIAQKKELKSAQSAIDAGDFSSAKGALTQAEALKSAMDDKTLAKYYFLNGLALASNGTASNADMKAALASFDEMKTVESRIGKSTYSSQVMESTQSMKRSLADRAQVALENEDYTSSSENFEFIFRLQPTDTLYLYNAAVLATQAKAYPRALGLYDELTKLGFTGVATEYSAVNAETGEEVLFESEFMRDISVKAGTHTDPKVTTTKSKVGDIARNIAVIYIELNDNEKAIQAIEEAKRIRRTRKGKTVKKDPI
jgi:tetratricopeptide (TPR) repeat protein